MMRRNVIYSLLLAAFAAKVHRGAAVIAGAATMPAVLGVLFAPAMEIEGVKLEEKVKLGDTGPELVL